MTLRKRNYFQFLAKDGAATQSPSMEAIYLKDNRESKGDPPQKEDGERCRNGETANSPRPFGHGAA
jgi:hypothetical protein